MRLLKYLIIMSCFVCGGCSKVEDVDALMVGKVVLIDPGHGGRDNGASYNGVLEDEINLNVSLLLYELLIDNGIVALVTRNSDYDLSSMYDNNHKAKDLKNRVKMINDNKVDLFISLHLNSYSSSDVSGAQVFYQKNSPKSKYFANILQKEMNKLYVKQRKTKEGDYYILENSQRNGVLIEMGFLSSSIDREKLLSFKYQKEISNTIFNSIKIYFLE